MVPASTWGCCWHLPNRRHRTGTGAGLSPMSPRGAGPADLFLSCAGLCKRPPGLYSSSGVGRLGVHCAFLCARTRHPGPEEKGHRSPKAAARRCPRRGRARTKAQAAPPTTTEGPTTTAMSLPMPPPTSSEPTSLAPRTPADVSCPLSMQIVCWAPALPLQPCLLPWPRHLRTPSVAMRSSLLNVSLSPLLPPCPLDAGLSPWHRRQDGFLGLFQAYSASALVRQPAPASVFLPLPVPCPGAFRPLGHAGQRRRQQVACQVALHAVVVAINFIYNDCAYVPLRLLARPPNPAQDRCLRFR